MVFVLTVILAVVMINVSEKTSEIRDVRITNATGTSVTVSWVSKEPIRGTVLYGEKDNWFPLL
ncbi:hypothetical protein KJ918_04695, partial [Patescibacteria group bacterium]|nr:hypothetical protein [Patescibacteria group bacterium]